MTLGEQYAHALYQLTEEHPQKGTTYLKSLQKVVTSRGHQRLLPTILAQYEKLALQGKRKAQLEKRSPEQEQTRILLELYNTLVNA